MAASVTYGEPPYPLPPVLPHSPLGGYLHSNVSPLGGATLQLIWVTFKCDPGQFVHGYNWINVTSKRSAAETARKGVPVSPTERSEPDELGYATVGRKVAGSSPEWREEAKFRVGAEVGSGGGGASRRRGGAEIFTISQFTNKNHRQKNA